MKPMHVSLTEAASFLGVSKATLRNWDRSGKLTAIRHPVNGYRLYDLNELKQLQAQAGLFPDEFLPVDATPLDLRGVRRLIARLHNILRDSDGQSNIIGRFDEVTKLLFAKVISDRNPDEASPFNSADEVVTADSVRRFYSSLAKKYTSLIPSQFSTLQCSDRAIVECTHALRVVDFSHAQFDVKGLAYEEIIRNTFDKGDHQQFFTPPHIVDFIVSMCEPYIQGAVCDPAAGTGGFLANVARRKLPYHSLTSIEIDERLCWVSGINMLLHEGHDVEALLFKEGGTLGREAERLFGRYDVIITNPPFGSDFSDPDCLGRMVLGAGHVSRRRGILFIERCHALLKDSGLLAIIIDEGVLNLPHAQDVRDFILDKFNLLAVVSLPETAFMPYATVNASILLLRKQSGGTKNDKVFFARADNVGRKPNGDEDIKYDRDGRSSVNSDLPQILEAWRKAQAGEAVGASTTIYVADVSANLASEENGRRIDFQFHHPSRWNARKLIDACRYPVRSLAEICTERNVSLIPSQDLADTIIPYTGLAQIESETGRAEQVPTPANSLKSSVKVYEQGDILFAKLRPNLRKVALAEFQEPGYASPECAVLVVNKGRDGKPIVDPLLLSILLRSDFVYGQIRHLIAGIGRPRISSKELRGVMVPIPPVEVQRQMREAYSKSQQESRRLQRAAMTLHEKARTTLVQAVDAVAAAFTKMEGVDKNERQRVAL